MDVSILSGVTSTDYMDEVSKRTLLANDTDQTFDSVLASAMDMLNETNSLQNSAESEKIKFALGEADNPHDMQIAEAKALTAIQYTTAVRDKALEAYKEIMNMQI